MCGILDLPPPLSKNSFSEHSENICVDLNGIIESQQLDAAANLKFLLGTQPNEILDVAVTCDCTLSK